MPGVAPPPPPLDASDMRIAVCASRFNEELSAALCEGAVDTITLHGGIVDGPHWVAGAFELPVLAEALAESGADAVVAIGCIIRGETPHFDLIARESARGLMDVSIASGVPVGNGIVTTEDLPQAQARAGGALGNKGAEAAEAAIEAAIRLRAIRP